MNVLPLTFSWTEKRNHEQFSSIKCGRKKKQQSSFHKGWFIPNEVLKRIFFTWSAKTVFVSKKWPSTYQVIMCETVPEVCEGDIPSYYRLFPNRLFYPFVDQLHCKFTPRYYTYTVQMIVERHFVPFSATRKSQNTPSKCMKLKKQPFKALLHRESF